MFRNYIIMFVLIYHLITLRQWLFLQVQMFVNDLYQLCTHISKRWLRSSKTPLPSQCTIKLTCPMTVHSMHFYRFITRLNILRSDYNDFILKQCHACCIITEKQFIVMFAWPSYSVLASRASHSYTIYHLWARSMAVQY